MLGFFYSAEKIPRAISVAIGISPPQSMFNINALVFMARSFIVIMSVMALRFQ